MKPQHKLTKIKHKQKTRKKSREHCQLTETGRTDGRRAIVLSPSWLATRYFHERQIAYAPCPPKRKPPNFWQWLSQIL